MKSKHPAMREWGQRSLSSTFFRTPSCSSSDSAQATPIKSPTGGSTISLSDFLGRRLHKTSVLPRTVQGKERPFSSPLGCSNESGSILRHAGVKKREDKESNVIDVKVFKQLRHTREEKEDFVGSCGFDEIGSFQSAIMRESSRKRKGPSVDGDFAKKHLVVLGDDPKPKRIKRRENLMGDNRPRPLFNHYANGSGWWDCNMEGVDGDEVGCNQPWEGVGSTTLGGMEWH